MYLQKENLYSKEVYPMDYLVKSQNTLATLCKIQCPKAQCVGNCPCETTCALDLS